MAKRRSHTPGGGQMGDSEAPEDDGPGESTRPSHEMLRAVSDVAPAKPQADAGPEQLLQALGKLASAGGRPLEEIADRYLACFAELFPDLHSAIRIGSRDLATIQVSRASRPLEPGACVISRTALVERGMPATAAPAPWVELVDEPVGVFDESAEAFDFALLDGSGFLGSLHCEHDHGCARTTRRELVQPFALQLEAALRETRRAEEAAHLEGKVHRLLDHASAPIVVIGKGRKVRVANRAFLAITGLSRKRILGKDVARIIPPAERRRLLPFLANALGGMPNPDFDLQMPGPDGTQALISVTTASVPGPSGDVEAVIAIGRDVTAIRALEGQVIHAEKLATIGQLSAGIVHELNNPLTSISVYSNYLLDKFADEGEAGDVEKLERIADSADRILRFTQDLIAYARPRVEAPGPVPIHEAINQAAIFCEHLLEECGARLNRDYGAGVNTVWAVRGQLEQVFVNLMTNACHALSRREGRVTVRTKEANDVVVICVEDDGDGMSEEVQQRVFDPFFSTKSEGRGTGLGMSIARNIVEQHGGSIEVRSEIGKGTTFEVRLPSQPRQDDEAGPIG